MQIIELVDIVSELCAFYERKEPKQSTIELWFRLVKNIPAEPLKWIVKKIQESHESFPKNVTSALWSSYTEWQQANPDKRAVEHYFDCPDCSEGLIFAKKEKNGLNYSYVFRCAKCHQNHNREYPAAVRLELLEEYYL